MKATSPSTPVHGTFSKRLITTRILISRSGFFTLRLLIALLLSLGAFLICTRTVPAFLQGDRSAKSSRPTLTFAERVAYQYAIEDVYWRHRIWPKKQPDSKPSVNAVMTQAQLEKKVTDYLRKSQALTDYWQRPITAEQLQAEMDRMAKHTRQPEVLRELFDALGNDPFVIAECLARPALADRLLKSWYRHDQRIHCKYIESETIKSDSIARRGKSEGKQSHNVKSREWDETVQTLAAIFNHSKHRPSIARHGSYNPPLVAARAVALCQSLPTPELTSLQDDEAGYQTILEKTQDHSKLASIAWAKEPLDSWLARHENKPVATLSDIKYNLPTISDGSSCVDNTWTPTAGAPEAAGPAVWTGTEMIVWGSSSSRNTGARYNPSTDTWAYMSTSNAPAPRGISTAVWTGTEMIVWGGLDDDTGTVFNTGGRYNPITDTWISTSLTNAPDPRYFHVAVWTGSEMIVWGGTGAIYFNTGGKYNPNTDSWTSTSTANAPTGRYGPTAVWSGNEMIIWGGTNDTSIFNTGGRYNPNTDTWAATTISNAPVPRVANTAVWSGTEMIVWGGVDENFDELKTGGRYNPSSNSWISTSTINAPTARYGHTAIWAGTQMIVWGGVGAGNYFNTGAKFDPGSNSWTATTITNAPAARDGHNAVWTGTEMIVWGGSPEFGDANTGGKYDPSTNSWIPTNTYNVPDGRTSHSAIWTGSEMIIWGGYTLGGVYPVAGGKYIPSLDTWVSTSVANAPAGRFGHTAIWTGSEMVVWGGSFYDNGYNYLNSGGRYNPITDNWIPTSTVNAPSARGYHSGVWDGDNMIIWGGTDDFTHSNTGGRYDPDSDSWTPTTTSGAPSGRAGHTAVWAGTQMIIWAGFDATQITNTGGKYNPNTDSWAATNISNAPPARINHTAVWTGTEMIVWGGHDDSFESVNTGGRYNPSLDHWTATNLMDAPDAREFQTAVWTGNEMIIWGGAYRDGFTRVLFDTGAIYRPDTDNWMPTALTNVPEARENHTAVWTGSEMIIWGGTGNTGGRYCVQSGPAPTPTSTPTGSPTATPTATSTATVTPSNTPRVTPTPRSRPTAHARPTPSIHITPLPPPVSPRPTIWPRPTQEPHITPLPPPSSPRPTPAPRP